MAKTKKIMLEYRYCFIAENKGIAELIVDQNLDWELITIEDKEKMIEAIVKSGKLEQPFELLSALENGYAHIKPNGHE